MLRSAGTCRGKIQYLLFQAWNLWWHAGKTNVPYVMWQKDRMFFAASLKQSQNGMLESSHSKSQSEKSPFCDWITLTFWILLVTSVFFGVQSTWKLKCRHPAAPPIGVSLCVALLSWLVRLGISTWLEPNSPAQSVQVSFLPKGDPRCSKWTDNKKKSGVRIELCFLSVSLLLYFRFGEAFVHLPTVFLEFYRDSLGFLSFSNLSIVFPLFISRWFLHFPTCPLFFLYFPMVPSFSLLVHGFFCFCVLSFPRPFPTFCLARPKKDKLKK